MSAGRRPTIARDAGLTMRKALAVALIIVGVIANNVVYLQDLWLGQEYISVDGWRAYAGLLVSFALILIGMVLLARGRATG